MRTITLSLILVLIWMISANAQPSLFLAPLIENDGRIYSPSIIGKKDGELFVIRQGGSTGGDMRWLERYNGKYELLKREELLVNPGTEDQEFEGIRLWGDNLYFFTSYINEGTQKHTLFVTDIDLVTLKPKAKRRMVTDYPIIKHQQTYSYQIYSSDNGLLHLIYGEVPVTKEGERVFKTMVVTSALDKIWEKQCTVHVPDNRFWGDYPCIDNAGNFFFYGRIYTEKNKQNEDINYDNVVYYLTNAGTEMKEARIDFPGKQITELDISMSPEGKLLCAGLFCDKATSIVKGSVLLTINPENMQITNKTIKDFAPGFLDLYATENMGLKGKQLYNYHLRPLVYKEDGGVLLFAEQIYYKVDQDMVNGHQVITRHYYYNDILIVNFDKEGKVSWTTKIPKYQHTTNDGGFFSSYTKAVLNNNTYILYNDHPDNLLEKEKGKLKDFIGKESITVICTISPDGKLTRKQLFDSKVEGIYSSPTVMTRIEDEIIVYGEKMRKYKFGTLKLN